ncbi:MAG: CAP domain-containing protein [Frankia sp.]|nr:CAP domain-containing protein [Frankia sp.]
MGSVPRTVSGSLAAIGIAVILSACQPGSVSPPAGGGPRPTTPAATKPATTAPTAPATTRPATTAPAAPTPPPAGATSKTDEIVRLTNIERAKVGCGPLTVDPALTAAAQGHSADMARNNYFSHTSLDGRTMGDRIRAAGFAFTAAAENIAAGSSTAAGTMDQWMGSSGHRANILNCAYTHIGVGYAEGGSYRYYWTQDFGRR